MRPKFLYHASPRKIIGEKLIPRQPEDLEEKKENLHNAVYATNIKNIAIAMAIISCNGVYYASLKFLKRPCGIIYKGKPKQKYIYLYILPSKTFRKSGEDGKQWISKTEVKPIKVEKIPVKENMHLVRFAEKEEIKRGLDKNKHKLK